MKLRKNEQEKLEGDIRDANKISDEKCDRDPNQEAGSRHHQQPEDSGTAEDAGLCQEGGGRQREDEATREQIEREVGKVSR